MGGSIINYFSLDFSSNNFSSNFISITIRHPTTTTVVVIIITIIMIIITAVLRIKSTFFPFSISFLFLFIARIASYFLLPLTFPTCEWKGIPLNQGPALFIPCEWIEEFICPPCPPPAPAASVWVVLVASIWFVYSSSHPFVCLRPYFVWVLHAMFTPLVTTPHFKESDQRERLRRRECVPCNLWPSSWTGSLNVWRS